MNKSYYQGEGSDTGFRAPADEGSSYQANSSVPFNRNASVNMNDYQNEDAFSPTNRNAPANMNGYQNEAAFSPTNGTTGLSNSATNKQGQSTGAEGNGPDFICRILDKLEKKFGGERFNNHDNDAKNLAMNQKMSARIKTIGPMVIQRLPQLLSTVVGRFM